MKVTITLATLGEKLLHKVLHREKETNIQRIRKYERKSVVEISCSEYSCYYSTSVQKGNKNYKFITLISWNINYNCNTKI